MLRKEDTMSIEELHQQGMNHTTNAAKLGIHRQTVSRTLLSTPIENVPHSPAHLSHFPRLNLSHFCLSYWLESHPFLGYLSFPPPFMGSFRFLWHLQTGELAQPIGMTADVHQMAVVQ